MIVRYLPIAFLSKIRSSQDGRGWPCGEFDYFCATTGSRYLNIQIPIDVALRCVFANIDIGVPGVILAEYDDRGFYEIRDIRPRTYTLFDCNVASYAFQPTKRLLQDISTDLREMLKPANVSVMLLDVARISKENDQERERTVTAILQNLWSVMPDIDFRARPRPRRPMEVN